jgi:four helix bundle protein
MSFTDFRAMPIWQKGLHLLLHVYQITKRFPPEEQFGITSDLRRSANSVLHNFGEGFGRFENKDKSRFYKISRGSAYEAISQITVSFYLKYISCEDQDMLIRGYKELIAEEDSLIKAVEGRPYKN